MTAISLVENTPAPQPKKYKSYEDRKAIIQPALQELHRALDMDAVDMAEALSISVTQAQSWFAGTHGPKNADVMERVLMDCNLLLAGKPTYTSEGQIYFPNTRRPHYQNDWLIIVMTTQVICVGILAYLYLGV